MMYIRVAMEEKARNNQDNKSEVARVNLYNRNRRINKTKALVAAKHPNG